MKSIHKVIKELLADDAYTYTTYRFLLKSVFDTNGRTEMVNSIAAVKRSIYSSIYDIVLQKVYPGRK